MNWRILIPMLAIDAIPLVVLILFIPLGPLFAFFLVLWLYEIRRTLSGNVPRVFR